MTGSLTRDTTVEGSEGCYTGHLSEQWSVWMPHGGFSIAVALRAVEQESHFTAPMSLTCHFLGAPEFAPIEIRVSSQRRTRTAESFRASVTQSGKPILELMVWTGDPKPGLEHFHTSRFGEWLLSDAYAPVACEGRISFYNRLWTERGTLVASASGTLSCRPRPGYEK